MKKLNLTALLIGFFLFISPVFPADETNIAPPGVQSSAAVPMRSAIGTAADKSPRRAGEGEIEEAPGASLRDPFWPIGFVPAGGLHGSAGLQQTSAVPESGPEIASVHAGLNTMLRIGGIIKKGGKFYATINGFTVQTGEVVSAVADGEVYRFVVVDIDLNKVKLKPIKK